MTPNQKQRQVLQYLARRARVVAETAERLHVDADELKRALVELNAVLPVMQRGGLLVGQVNGIDGTELEALR